MQQLQARGEPIRLKNCDSHDLADCTASPTDTACKCYELFDNVALYILYIVYKAALQDTNILHDTN